MVLLLRSPNRKFAAVQAAMKHSADGVILLTSFAAVQAAMKLGN